MKEQENVAYTRLEYRLAMEKEDILPFVATQMDLGGLVLSETSQVEKDKHCTVSLPESKTKPNTQNTNLTKSRPCGPPQCPLRSRSSSHTGGGVQDWPILKDLLFPPSRALCL